MVVPSLLQDTRQLGSLPLVTDFLAGTAYVALFTGIIAVVYTCWLTLPLGALGGAVYERTRTLS